MHLSVIIPTCGNLEALARVLHSLAYQRDCQYEILVIKDMTEDQARAEDIFFQNAESHGRHFPHYRAYCTDGCGTGAAFARNVGINMALGKRLLFLDDDCVCPPGLLAAHAARGTGDALVGFRRNVHKWQAGHADAWELPADKDSRWAHLRTMEMYCKSNSPHLNAFVFTCHLSVPAAAARAVGGFWEEMKGSGFEDREFALRLQRYGLGFDVLRFPQVSHLHHPQRPSQREHASRNRLLFAQTRDDRTIVVRNGGPIHDPHGVAEQDARSHRRDEPCPGGPAVL